MNVSWQTILEIIKTTTVCRHILSTQIALKNYISFIKLNIN